MATPSKLILPLFKTEDNDLPATIAEKTRRIYDRVSFIYPASTFFFHSRAHRTALECAGIRNGMRVLEVATGSGEMFRRLVGVNPDGETVGLDLSPNMAARTQKRVRREFPSASAHCKAVDARFMPFRDESFDAVVCCYLLELLSGDDIIRALLEVRRVLRYRGTFSLVMIAQERERFNQLYRVAGRLAPAFWGRQVERQLPELIESIDFSIFADHTVRQSGYPSRIISARK